MCKFISKRTIAGCLLVLLVSAVSTTPVYAISSSGIYSESNSSDTNKSYASAEESTTEENTENNSEKSTTDGLTDVSEGASNAASDSDSVSDSSDTGSSLEEDEEIDPSAPMTENVADATKGIVQVNSIYTNDAGKEFIILGCTGFLIGNTEDGEYVITTNSVVAPTKPTRDDAFRTIGVDEDEEDWDKIDLGAQVVVEGDITIEATVKLSSPS